MNKHDGSLVVIVSFTTGFIGDNYTPQLGHLVAKQ